MPFFRQLADAAKVEPREGSFIERRSLIRTFVLIAIWLLLVGAAALPQWVGAAIEREESARDLILAVDLSASMDQRDIESDTATPLSRLDVVKQVIGEFIAGRDSDRIGLIVFGSQAYVQLPFTRDREVAQSMLEATVPGMAGPHTALGDAIGLAIRTFETSQVEDRLLIVLTDGADTGSRMSPINAAQIAAEDACRKAMDHGLRSVEVRVKGPGAGRESALRAVANSGLKISLIRDVTPIPHNGCRPPKKRRV